MLWQLLLELSSGMTELPPLGATDSVAAGRMNQYLCRRPLWVGWKAEVVANGQRLSSYSLRHGYAYRSAIVYNLPVRVAKDLMGHSLDVHVKHYGSFIDAKDVGEMVDAARAKVLNTSGTN